MNKIVDLCDEKLLKNVQFFFYRIYYVNIIFRTFQMKYNNEKYVKLKPLYNNMNMMNNE